MKAVRETTRTENSLFAIAARLQPRRIRPCGVLNLLASFYEDEAPIQLDTTCSVLGVIVAMALSVVDGFPSRTLAIQILDRMTPEQLRGLGMAGWTGDERQVGQFMAVADLVELRLSEDHPERDEWPWLNDLIRTTLLGMRSQMGPLPGDESSLS